MLLEYGSPIFLFEFSYHNMGIQGIGFRGLGYHGGHIVNDRASLL